MRTILFALVLSALLAACNDAPPRPVERVASDIPGDDPVGDPGGGEDSGDEAPADGVPVVILFAGDSDFEDDFELFAADEEGNFLNLSHDVADEYDVTLFEVSPDKTKVAFAIEAGADSGLYVTLVGLDTTVRLSPGTETIEAIAWASTGAWIAYLAHGESTQLYGVRPNGSEHRRLSVGANEVRAPFFFSPSGEWIAYRSDRAVQGQFMVHVTQPDGIGETQVSDTLAGPTSIRLTRFAWTADDCLSFRTDMEEAGVSDVYVACADDDWAPTLVSNETGTTGSVFDWLASPDGLQFLYRRVETTTNKRALFLGGKDGSPAKQVFVDPSGLIVYEWNSTGTHFAFRAANKSVHVGDGTGAAREVALAGFVHEIRWSPSGVNLAILMGASVLSPRELHCLDVTTTNPPTQVSEDDEDVDAVAWYADQDQDGFGECDGEEVLAYAVEADCDDDGCDINPDCEEICIEADEAEPIDDTDACSARIWYSDLDEIEIVVAGGAPCVLGYEQVADEELTYLWTVIGNNAVELDPAHLGRLSRDEGRAPQTCSGGTFTHPPRGTCYTPKGEFIDTNDGSNSYRATTCQYYDDKTANACVTTMHDIPGFAPQPARIKPCTEGEQQTAAEDDWPGGFRFVIDPGTGRFAVMTYVLDLDDANAPTWYLDFSGDWYLWAPAVNDILIGRDSDGIGVVTFGTLGYPAMEFRILGRNAEGTLIKAGNGYWYRTEDLDLSQALTGDGDPVDWLTIDHLPIIES